nr:hypothetical protein [Candidatus Coxiella mudrowiae]
MPTLDSCEKELMNLCRDLKQRLSKHPHRIIHKQFVKIKFNDFNITKAELVVSMVSFDLFKRLLHQPFKGQLKPVRLYRSGNHFCLRKHF